MADNRLFVVEGFSANGYVAGLTPEQVALCAQRALNKIADRTRTRADRAVRDQIAFPASYLGPGNKRLTVSQRASAQNLSVTIQGSSDPTSLARFTKEKVMAPGKRHKDGGVSVTVHYGAKKLIKRAFLMNLKNGNIGLAVRTSGGLPPGAYKPRSIGNNLYLLYGPSVTQALISARESGVYEEIAPEMMDALDYEFRRLVDLEVSKNA